MKLPKINVYLPDDLAEQVRKHQISVSTICQEALREEVERMSQTEFNDAVTTLTVNTGPGRSHTEKFKGYWVIEPGEQSPSGNGACFGVARTAKGKVAVYTFYVNDDQDASLGVNDNIFQATLVGGLPRDIADKFEAREANVVLLDI
jgi:hypothetical protein